MKKAQKKKIIEGMKTTIVTMFAEHTPPEVKYSHTNYLVANALQSLDKLLTHATTKS